MSTREFDSLLHLLNHRRSVRGFLPDPVPAPVLTRIFEAAQLCPSNCNVQPWQVFVASGNTRDILRQRMLELAHRGDPICPDYGHQPTYTGVYRQRQVECATQLYDEMGIERHDKAGRARAMLRNFELFDAPHVAFIGMSREFGTTVALDVGMYLQTLMLLMSAHGLASCAQGSMRYYPDVVREVFSIDDDVGILVGLSFGYEDLHVPANRTRTHRAPLQESVRFSD